MGTFIDFSPSSTQSQIKKKAATETNLQSILVQVKSIFEKTTYTSMMVGEEGGGTPGKPPVDKPAPPTMSTQAIGEEGGGTPGKPPVDKPVPPDEVTTMVTGEEGGGTPAKPPVDIVKPVPPVEDTNVAKQRVKEGRDFIKEHIKDIKSDDTISNDITADNKGNAISNKVIDAKKAFKFFNLMQGDKGIAAPGNNGSDFNVGAIKERIQIIKDKLKNLDKLPLRDAGVTQTALENELGMLKEIKSANKDGDKVVTAKEMNAITKDGKLHFQTKTALESDDPVETKPKPPSTIQDFILEILKKLFEGLFGQKPIYSEGSPGMANPPIINQKVPPEWLNAKPM